MEHIGIHLMTLVKSLWGDSIRLDEMTEIALFHDFLDIFVGYDSTDKRYKLYIRLSNTDEEYNPKYSRKNCPKVCFFETTNNIVTTVAYIGDFLANGGQAEYGDYSFSLRDNIITQQAGNYISVTRKGIHVGIDPKERSIASFYYSKAHRSQLINSSLIL